MILSDTSIIAAMRAGTIVIEPFDPACLGGNSYDVHLGPKLVVYKEDAILDCKIENPTVDIEIGDDGIELLPGHLYLASTVEYTETHAHVPYLDGKSSIGRLGIGIHITAGRGDCNYKGHWTMEITAVVPVRIYHGMPIGQLAYHEISGDVVAKYDTKPGAKYASDPRNPDPRPSAMWRNFK